MLRIHRAIPIWVTALVFPSVLSCSDAANELDASSSGGLFVTVQNLTNRSPVMGAVVSLNPPVVDPVVTDIAGTAFFPTVAAGFYAVRASTPDAAPVERPIAIVEGQLVELVLAVTPSVNPPAGQLSATILSPSPGTTVRPMVPIQFSARISSRQPVRVSWTSQLDGELDRTPPDASGVAQFTTNRLSVGTHVVTLRVSELNGGASAERSVAVNVSTGMTGMEPDPVVLTATTTGSSVRLDWSASSEMRSFDYRVYRAEDAGAAFQVLHVEPDVTRRSFEDRSVQFGVRYLYRVAVRLSDGTEAFSNVVEASIGEFIDVATQVEYMRVDPRRPYLYALDRVNNSLLFINLNTRAVDKTIFVGSTPVDFDIDATGDTLYVANFGSTEVAVIDLETQTKARSIFVDPVQGTWGGNPYRLTCLGDDRLVFTSEDQWNNIKMVRTTDGGHISHAGSVYQPDVVASSDGRSVYVAESGSTGSELIRFDVNGTMLTQVDSSARASGFGSRLAVLSGDGMFIYYGNRKLLARNLSSLLGTFSEQILATNEDGTVAIGSTNFFSGTTFSVLRPLPLSTQVMTLSPDNETLYLYDTTLSRIYIYDISDLE